MELSLEKNAFSSLSISIDCFKVIYYQYSEISESVYEEKAKIGIVFLENAIELLLKSILYAKDNNSIFFTNRKGEQKTITYGKALSMYCKIYDNDNSNDTQTLLKDNQLKKVKIVLEDLRISRNNITHYKFDRIVYDELICIFINTFEIIYNYLFSDLKKLTEVGKYFASDSVWGVETIHGIQPLLSNSAVYNNVIDFLDELLSDSSDYIFKLCYKNPLKKIDKFADLLNSIISDNSNFYKSSLTDQSMIIQECCDLSEGFGFTINKCDNLVDVYFRYLPFYNVGIFINEVGEVLFMVDFYNEEIFIYSENKSYPEYDEPDEFCQWESDLENKICYKQKANYENLIQAIENVINREFDEHN